MGLLELLTNTCVENFVVPFFGDPLVAVGETIEGQLTTETHYESEIAVD